MPHLYEQVMALPKKGALQNRLELLASQLSQDNGKVLVNDVSIYGSQTGGLCHASMKIMGIRNPIPNYGRTTPMAQEGVEFTEQGLSKGKKDNVSNLGIHKN